MEEWNLFICRFYARDASFVELALGSQWKLHRSALPTHHRLTGGKCDAFLLGHLRKILV